jgi:hypothetical protein
MINNFLYRWKQIFCSLSSDWADDKIQIYTYISNVTKCVIVCSELTQILKFHWTKFIYQSHWCPVACGAMLNSDQIRICDICSLFCLDNQNCRNIFFDSELLKIDLPTDIDVDILINTFFYKFPGSTLMCEISWNHIFVLWIIGYIQKKFSVGFLWILRYLRNCSICPYNFLLTRNSLQLSALFFSWMRFRISCKDSKLLWWWTNVWVLVYFEIIWY